MRCNIINMAGETTQLDLQVNVSCYDLLLKIEQDLNLLFSNIDLFSDNEERITANPVTVNNFVLYDDINIHLVNYGKPIRLFDDSVIYKNSHKTTGWDIDKMEKKYGPVELWDVAWMNDMSYAFYDNWNFNKNINEWDVSNVYNMEHMFNGSVFNQPLNKWDVSNVMTMESMFCSTEKFNQNINNWDVSNVVYLGRMFAGASNFNQPLNNWNVTNVQDMGSLFCDCYSFNQPLNNWNVSKVVDMSYMFAGCDKFNQDIRMWRVNNVKNMDSMFLHCDSINKNFIKWIYIT